MHSKVRLTLLLSLALAGCDAIVGGPPLVSGMSAPSANAANAEPQPVNSLPPGAEGIGRPGPNGTFPNDASVTFSLPRL